MWFDMAPLAAVYKKHIKISGWPYRGRFSQGSDQPSWKRSEQIEFTMSINKDVLWSHATSLWRHLQRLWRLTKCFRWRTPFYDVDISGFSRNIVRTFYWWSTKELGSIRLTVTRKSKLSAVWALSTKEIVSFKHAIFICKRDFKFIAVSEILKAVSETPLEIFSRQLYCSYKLAMSLAAVACRGGGRKGATAPGRQARRGAEFQMLQSISTILPIFAICSEI